MSSKRIAYIAGPIRHKKWYHAPAFYQADKALRQQGFDVLNPHKQDKDAGFDVYQLDPADHDWSTYPPGFDKEACYKRCIEAVTECDLIYMLKGWQKSTGASAEHALAKWMGKEIIYEDATECGCCGRIEPEGHDCFPEATPDPMWDVKGPGPALNPIAPEFSEHERERELRIHWASQPRLPGDYPAYPGLVKCPACQMHRHYDEPCTVPTCTKAVEDKFSVTSFMVSESGDYVIPAGPATAPERDAIWDMRGPGSELKPQDLRELEHGKIPCERCGEPMFPEDKTHMCSVLETSKLFSEPWNPMNHGVKGGKPSNAENPSALPTDSKARLDYPLCSGMLLYFPRACAAVAKHSKLGNDQHNPGEPMHWAKEKSIGRGDQIVRHLVDGWLVCDTDREAAEHHFAGMAWRALELLERFLAKYAPFS